VDAAPAQAIAATVPVTRDGAPSAAGVAAKDCGASQRFGASPESIRGRATTGPVAGSMKFPGSV